tara:strand:- start:1617 stop:1904 length:288 start_codon:yes stop_codon:yes gene_type:complete
MLVEMGSMLSLNSGVKVYDALKENDKVVYVFIETARSNDLFEEKQFGEFGEASLLTVIVEDVDEDEIFSEIYETANLDNEDGGIIYIGQKIEANY